MSLWVLGLIPIILACLHLMIVARGNAETLRSLVQNLNITALVLATTLPLGSTILTWWFFFSFLVKVGRPKPLRKPGWVLSITVLAIFVAFVDFFAMPLPYGAINLAIFAMLRVCVIAVAVTPALSRKFADRARKVGTGMARIWALVFLIGPLVIWLGFLGVWLPQKRLTVGATDIEPVYVLSYDDHWMKYMDGAHKVHVVPTKDVTSRDTLDISRSTWRKTPFDLWQEWRTSRSDHQPGAPSAPIPTTPPSPTPTPGTPKPPTPAP